MRRTTAIKAAAIIALAAASGPGAAGAFIFDSGIGRAPSRSDFDATFRHVASDAQDYEIGLGSGAGRFGITRSASWIQGDNDFLVAFDAETNEITLSFNGADATWMAPGNISRLTFDLIARNRSNDAELELSGLTLNGMPIDTGRAAGAMLASNMAGTNALSNSTWLTISGMPGGSWTLAGTLRADWTGPAPSRSHTRLDLGFEIPSPGSIGLLALVGAGIVLRRKSHATA